MAHIDVVVIGGGYAGVLAANRLTQRDDVTVTLVNPRPVFVQRIRLHQLVSGTDDAVVGLNDVLSDRVRVVVDTATGIDAAGRAVALAGGGTIGYDYLIYAVGSASAPQTVPGAAEFGYPVATLEQAQRLRSVLDVTPGSAPVTVVGAGSTGIEIAAELAEQGRPVTLVCGGVLGPYLHPRARRAVAGRLAKLGVSVRDGDGTEAVAVTRDAVRLRDGSECAAAVTVWAAGFGVPDLAARSGLSTDAVGRLRTDETLTSVDDGRIVAAGDSAAPSDLPLRMSCQTAGPLGAHAADTVLARLAGEQPAEIAVGCFGQCVAVGRRAAVLQLAAKDDTAGRFFLGGRLAAMVKTQAFTLVIGRLAAEARKPGTFSWGFTDAKRAARVRARRAEAQPAR